MKKIFLIFLLSNLLFGNSYDLKELKQKDNSLAKDYYIYRLLEENNISKNEAQSLNSHIFRYVGKIKTELEKIIPVATYINPLYKKCFTYTKNNILDANLTCQSVRLNSITFIASLNNETRKILASNMQQEKPEVINLLLAFNQEKPVAYLDKKEDVDNFFKLYNYSMKIDYPLSTTFINKLSFSQNFKQFVQNVVIKKENPNFSLSLLNVKPENTQENSAFFLGVNALVYNKKDLAFNFFEQAYKSFSKQENKDNALFWMYMIKKDKQDLITLANSTSLNIYNLYARELINLDFPKILNPKPKKEKNFFNMQDPFAWQELSKEIANANPDKLKNLANQFNTQETLPIYAYILERLYKFKNHYFIMPYFEFIKDYDTKRQALILAIARQESRFIPTAISTSYALGIMQFMPFLANHIGNKELKIENFDQDLMFNPKIAYYFANHHLNYLETHLNSPLFVAYAYNGGIGFTKRMLARKDLFKKGEFEPFLSMELVPYQESRIYGKKVLANYIVYRYLLNDNIKISDIFENLAQNNDLNKS
ncbi:lytic transglycosylase domain-containing protein [Campylobacter novaezeelandiae]|uniref:lytic transglycosylase domain-containing protein n=1 Tax=Campylobacter novaezeelandiae TaxID=2267891 RepID=UPI00103707BA|nr:lytic transglycosylase domain-containing protein [Campylobacter novaezeelandiae]QWU79915.1 soluble lytic murein transglycosylase [Campylobacter novaezeelandiae]TBR78040.1 lytic transglycosylase domain-containing protein [Campylobacter novaezeelandiae]TBR79499.1 lytic transglycosylase domain-containing protein [Campylobacter novaezeelandiae]